MARSADTLSCQGAPSERRVSGRYLLQTLLGRGASKEVYLAIDERLGREVALALIVRAQAGSAERERVRRETELTARLGDHPNIVTVFDAGEEHGIPWIVMRLMRGGSLAECIAGADGRRLAVGKVARIGRQVAAALSHAHAHGVVHRDLKPDNIWLSGDGTAALGDFGIALDGDKSRLTAEGMLVGTARYLPPEQARGLAVDARSDLYSLGVTLYEAVCGTPPFRGDEPLSVITQHLHVNPVAPSRHVDGLPPLFERVVLRLLAKSKEARPASAVAVRDELDQIVTGAGAVLRRRGTDTLDVLARGTFVGRGPELQAATTALDEALGGCGRLVVLTGEPGVGKSRLAEELATLGTMRGALVLRGRSREGEGAPPYWPWEELLRGLSDADLERPAPELVRFAAKPGTTGELTDLLQDSGPLDEEGRLRLFEAVAAALRSAAARKPLTLIFEDVHWIDRSSAQVLVHLMRHFARQRVLVVATCRAEALERDHPFREALGEVRREQEVASIELSCLSLAEVARFFELATGQSPAPGLATAVHARTGGNPFFVEEVLRTLLLEGTLQDADIDERLRVVPSNVRAVVGGRLGRLSEPAGRLLAAGAIVGRVFAAEIAASSAGMSRPVAGAALAEASAAQLVREERKPEKQESPPASGVCWRFAHAIVRDVVLGDLTPTEQAALHAAVGESLARRWKETGADGPARHFVAAARGGGAVEPALRYSFLAAADARRIAAWTEEAAHHERVLEMLELDEREHDPLIALNARLAAADAHARAGDLDLARAGYPHAAELAARIGDAEGVARAALGFAKFQDYGVVDEPALSLLEEALALLPPGDGATRAEVLGCLAVRLDPVADQGRREELLDDAVAMARRLGETVTLARLLALSPLVRWPLPENRERRLADAGEVVMLADAGGDREAALWALIILHSERFAAGDIEGASRDLAAYERHARTLRQPYYRWYALVMHATQNAFSGDLDAAEEVADEAYHLIRLHEKDAEQEHAVQRLMIALMRGRPEDADAACLRALAERHAELPMWAAMAAQLDCELGLVQNAERVLGRLARNDFAAVSETPDRVAALVALSETCAHLGDTRHAVALYDLLLPYADVNVLTDRAWAAWGAAARQLGRLAALQGRDEQAAGHFKRALELERSWRARPWVAHTLLAYAAALPGARDAAASLAEARALCDELGMHGVLRRVSAVEPTTV